MSKKNNTYLNLDSVDTLYNELNLNIRHYSNLRFALLPIFAVVNSGLIYLLIQFYKEDVYVMILYLTSVTGLVISIVFLIFQRRIDTHIKHFRALDSSFKLEYQIWSGIPNEGLIKSFMAVRFLYIYTGLLWCFILLISLVNGT